MVVDTAQPADEIIAGLEAHGYEDRGDGIYVLDAFVTDVVYDAVGLSDGLLFAGQNADFVAERMAIDPAVSGPDALRMIVNDATDGPLRYGTVAEPARCGTLYGAQSEVPSTGGDWIAYIGEGADASRVRTQPDENVSVPGTLQNDESRPLWAALGMWALRDSLQTPVEFRLATFGAARRETRV